MKYRRYVSGKKGFTLIELLVVIAIIGLLSSVILASIQSSRTKAEWRAFEKQLIEIRTAVQLYREKNDGNWPPTLEGNLALNGSGGLLEILRNSGVYGVGDLKFPNSNIVAFYQETTKLNTSDGLNYSCGHSDYQSVYAVIGFYYNQLATPITDTIISRAYINGIQLGVYIYCIEFR